VVRMRVLVGIMVAAVVIAVASLYLLFIQPPVREIRLETWEFGFNGPKGGPTIRLKVGEIVKIVLVNKGATEHEFMPVKDLNGFLKELHDIVGVLQAKGLKEEDIKNSHMIHRIHEKYSAGKIFIGNKSDMHVHVNVGEYREFLLSFDQPGTYTAVCASFGLTFPQTHADNGMFFMMIVEP